MLVLVGNSAEYLVFVVGNFAYSVVADNSVDNWAEAAADNSAPVAVDSQVAVGQIFVNDYPQWAD